MIGCKYTGTFLDFSGYGDANRNFIVAMYLSGIDISTELVIQVRERGDFGWMGDLCTQLEGKKHDYKIKIIHLTPDMYPRYMEKGKFHIGHLFWETDKLPKEWVKPCNLMDEIWTASEEQAAMIESSGVTVPIKWFPQPINTIPAQSEIKPYIIPHFNGMLFYSVFQWIDRKNPQALLKAYWKAFSGKNDVALLLKTYRANYSDTEFELIRKEIREWKGQLGLDHYPQVMLVKDLVNTDAMHRLHQTGDCFVTASRGEGWQRPAVEAMLLAKPVISIERTGFADYLPADHFYPCACYESEVVEQPWIAWYKQYMNWLEISEKDLIDNMQKVYKNQKESKIIGKKAQDFVVDQFNFWSVGQQIKERLEEINKIL